MHPNKVYKLSLWLAVAMYSRPPPWPLLGGEAQCQQRLINPPERQESPAGTQGRATLVPVWATALWEVICAQDWKRKPLRGGQSCAQVLRFGQNSQHPGSLCPVLPSLRPVGGTEGGPGWPGTHVPPSHFLHGGSMNEDLCSFPPHKLPLVTRAMFCVRVPDHQPRTSQAL